MNPLGFLRRIVIRIPMPMGFINLRSISEPVHVAVRGICSPEIEEYIYGKCIHIGAIWYKSLQEDFFSIIGLKLDRLFKQYIRYCHTLCTCEFLTLYILARSEFYVRKSNIISYFSKCISHSKMCKMQYQDVANVDRTFLLFSFIQRIH